MNNSIFVYGTLKRGFCNNSLLEKSVFFGMGLTSEKYLLIDNGLPCLIKNSSSKYSTNIKGDIYLVNDRTLSDLDDLESHPFLYKREEIIVIRTQTIKNGIPIKCWCYFFNDGYETDNIITDGEWK